MSRIPTLFGLRCCSTKAPLYEEEEKATKKQSNVSRLELFEVIGEEEEWSSESVLADSGDWSEWDPEVRQFLELLHDSDMDLEKAKKVWSSYKALVKVHPEIGKFLKIMFRQLGPFVFFDHLETIYYDIVVTRQLTTVIGRDMVRQYLNRSDLASAESVLADLHRAKLDVSGSTMAMLIRLSGHAGNERKVWEYFDNYVQTKSFKSSSYAYLCGSLFLGLGHLPEPQDSHIISIFQLMVSTEEYYPNSPEYYRWLEDHNAHPSQAAALAQSLAEKAASARAASGSSEDVEDESSMIEDGMPDFPMQPPVRLPPPDAFCFNVVFMGLTTLESANTIWDLAQKLRRVTPSVYANYINCLAKIDVHYAYKIYKEFLLTTYSEKSKTTTLKLRTLLTTAAAENDELEILQQLLEEKKAIKRFFGDDIVHLSKVRIHKGDDVVSIVEEASRLNDEFGLSSQSFCLRCIILECLQISKPEEATRALEYAINNNWNLYFHHQTPIPLWYFHEWLAMAKKNKAAGSSVSQEDKAREVHLAQKFKEANEFIFNSQLGPSTFYIRVITTLHPSKEEAFRILDMALDSKKITGGALVFSIINSENLPFDRTFGIVQHLAEKHDAIFSPIVAKPLLVWGANEGKYKECFEIAERIIDNAVNAFEAGVESTRPTYSGPEAVMPTPTFLLGSWVHNLSTVLLSPFGIITHLHNYYGFKYKYRALSKEQTIELQKLFKEEWLPRVKYYQYHPTRTTRPLNNSSNLLNRRKTDKTSSVGKTSSTASSAIRPPIHSKNQL